MSDDLAAAILAELRAIRSALDRLAGDRNPDDWTAKLLREAARMPCVTAGELLARADGRPDLFALLEDYARPNGAMALGRRLAGLVGVEVDGLRLERTGEDRGTATYRVRTLRTCPSEVLTVRRAD
ncbi:MAG: hypothetical protein U1F41_06845 [Burkholderiales bacterium]